jgi:hypothetical protein
VCVKLSAVALTLFVCLFVCVCEWLISDEILAH